MMMIHSCDRVGLAHLWVVGSQRGEFGAWKMGTMDMRSCLRCSEVQYFQFTASDGTVIDIDALCRRSSADKSYPETPDAPLRRVNEAVHGEDGGRPINTSPTT